MTKKELYTAVAQGQMNDEIMATAAEYLTKMDESSENRRNANAEKSAEAYAPFVKIFADAMTDTPKTAAELLPLFEGMETPSGKVPTVQFVSAVARKVVAQNMAAKTEVKVTGKGKQVGYTAVL